MSNASNKPQVMDEERLMELVKLFEGFTQASSTFAQSYAALEQRIAQLSNQLEEQSFLLERTAGFLSSVLAHVQVGIVVVDMDGRVSLFNEEAERLTGLLTEDVIGGFYGDIFPAPVNEPTSAIYTLTHGSVIESRERDLSHTDGNTLPVRFSTAWIYGDDGQPFGVLEFFEDLRPLRELQTRMQQSASLAALGEMAAQVAHELRNPLAGVQGFAQFLQEDIEETHPSRKIAEKIMVGVKDIDRIASRLLEFTRPMSPNCQEVDLCEILEQETELARAELADREDVALELEVPRERVKVWCDGSLIKQAVLNLLKNAMQALNESGGKILISLHWDLLRNRVHIMVSDNGIGIEEGTLPKIFNPFFTTRSQGTGLGLAMVKKIVEAHRGTIDVTSRLGERTNFLIELPIARGE
ncbi:MAG: ATP-binding protein [bacterium]